MKKILMLAALTLPLSMALTSCGGSTVSLPGSAGGTLPNHVNFGANVSDGSLAVVHTLATATSADSWSSTPTAARVSFTAYPGSDAVYIQSYHVVSDSMGNADSTEMPAGVYIQAGYSCADQVTLATKNQSCTSTDSGTTTATGITSKEISFDFTTPLFSVVKSTKSAASRTVKLEFTGVSTRNEKVTYDVAVNFVATYSEK